MAIHNFLVDFVLFAPVAILYYESISGSFALGMSVFAAYQLAAAIFEVPTGIVSDLVGRRMTVVLGAISYFLAYFLYAIGASYAILIIGAVIAGLGRAFYSGNNDALLYDTLRENGKESMFEHYMGRTMSTGQLALATSAIVGAVIASISFPLVMWLSVIPQLLNVVVGFMFDEPKVQTEKIETNVYAHLFDSLKNFMKNKKLKVLSTSHVIAQSVGEASYQFRAAFVQLLWPVWAIGIVNFVTNMGASASFYYSGPIIKRFSAKTLLIFAKAYSIVISLIALVFPTVISPLLLTTSAVFYGTNITAKNNLFQKEFTDHQRATMSSINSFFQSIAFSIAAVGVGMIADKIGPINTLIIAYVVQVIPLGLYIKFFGMN